MDIEVLRGKLRDNTASVCMVGLGYVGLSLSVEFAKSGLKVIGFDVDTEKIEQLQRGIDKTGEVGSTELERVITENSISFTSTTQDISGADFFIIAVPTPIKKSKEPDLSFIKGASEIVGEHLGERGIVVLESTVYPGVTEEVVMPILERISGLKCGTDFKIGYSPERINPGDSEHGLGNIIKVVSGIDKETLELLAELYSKVTKAGVFKAKNIKTAEAAKVIENIQRDLNISLMNELAIIFEKMDIYTQDVLEAAYTKWNFGRYRPGLVGGHCIPVDPYYLVYKAKGLGYRPQVILSGRAINDYMPKHVAELCIKGLNKAGKVLKKSKVLLLGLTFKEDVRDTRTSQAVNVIKELKEFDIDVLGYDPLIEYENIKGEFGIKPVKSLEDLDDIDCVILVVPHKEFRDIELKELKKIMTQNPVLIDLKAFFERDDVKKAGFIYKGL